MQGWCASSSRRVGADLPSATGEVDCVPVSEYMCTCRIERIRTLLRI